MTKKDAFLSLAIIFGIMLVGCNGSRKRQQPTGNTSTSGVVVMACDASFENIMQQEIDVFEFIYPNASILSYYTNESACIDSLINGSARLAVLSHDLTKEQKEVLKGKKHFAKSRQIAVDAIAVIVNPENPIENLSIKELSEILSGEVTRWDELSPSKLGNIQVIFDHSGSSVVKYVTDSIMQGAKFGSNVYSANTMDSVFLAVQNRRNAIGLIGVSWISTDMKTADLSTEERVKTLERDDSTATDFNDNIKVLPIRRNNSLVAYKPYQAYIFDGSYPLYRSIYMINTGAAGTLANGFYAFVTSFQGQKLIQSTGVLPATVYRRMVSVD